jgi:uncharacterized membrane protein (UPF0127 family)
LGLSGHAPLAEDEGMLFIFDEASVYPFWMKDMLFPIDIIWIDANSRISYIESAVTPDTYPKVFAPDAPALYTLEVKSGTAERLGFKIGDAVRIAK